MTNTKKIRLVPNTERIICKYLDISSSLRTSDRLLVPGQLKAGENLLCAIVVDAGNDTKFKKGQLIYYSEYSASQLIDVGNVIRFDGGYAELQEEDNKYIVIAEDDIMAYEEEVDPDLKVETGKKNVWKEPVKRDDAVEIIKP